MKSRRSPLSEFLREQTECRARSTAPPRLGRFACPFPDAAIPVAVTPFEQNAAAPLAAPKMMEYHS
ncbi:hypothetical protein SAMN06295955_1055 [Sphingopyxis indica]|uniref:Uncharacterized protein n=1 Tax=Sphingopyxis indica TaxID=436663 RepID=A0A239H9S4_9SPHN|nr:hypothetical protein SAMN06295955_1055 [Sphingopyxis indica]